MSYFEPQWTPKTILISQIVQVFNIEGNEDLVIAYHQRATMKQQLTFCWKQPQKWWHLWVKETRLLVLSDQLFPALKETMRVLEAILFADKH